MFSNKFDGFIWKIIQSVDGRLLVFDVRNEHSKTIAYYTMELSEYRIVQLPVSNPNWWSTLEAFDEATYLIQYKDQKDPTNKEGVILGESGKQPIDLEKIPTGEDNLKHPFLYDVGSEYHKTVSDFLGLELLLPCEYLEFQGNIIISYYLRSGNVFDRFLLIIKDGERKLKETQDKDIKGFAAGSYFGLDGKIFYVKNRNEICIYSL